MITGKLLVANRGEIAVRICRAAAELNLKTVAVYPANDASSLHTQKADEARILPGRGVAAYLDGDAIIAAALEATLKEQELIDLSNKFLVPLVFSGPAEFSSIVETVSAANKVEMTKLGLIE